MCNTCEQLTSKENCPKDISDYLQYDCMCCECDLKGFEATKLTFIK